MTRKFDQILSERPITPEEAGELQTAPSGSDDKLKIKIPPKKETRSARLQLLLKPSLKARLTARANKEGLTVNDLVNIILDQTV